MPGEFAGRQDPRLFAILESVEFRVVFFFAHRAWAQKVGGWFEAREANTE